jgi:hypothetical protein
MLKILRIIIVMILAFGQGSYAQNKILDFPLNDSSFWEGMRLKNLKKLGLSDLTKSKVNLHFRLASEIQVVDIWSTDNKRFDGILVNFTSRYDKMEQKIGKSKANKYFTKKVNLDTTKAREVYNLFRNLSVFTIPTDLSIKGWQKGDDGVTYIIEHSTPTTYSFKDYWTPSYYKDEIKEAETIDSLVREVDKTLQMKHSFAVFIQTLPYGCYMAGSNIFTCKENKVKRLKASREAAANKGFCASWAEGSKFNNRTINNSSGSVKGSFFKYPTCTKASTLGAIIFYSTDRMETKDFKKIFNEIGIKNGFQSTFG